MNEHNYTLKLTETELSILRSALVIYKSAAIGYIGTSIIPKFWQEEALRVVKLEQDLTPDNGS